MCGFFATTVLELNGNGKLLATQFVNDFDTWSYEDKKAGTDGNDYGKFVNIDNDNMGPYDGFLSLTPSLSLSHLRVTFEKQTEH